MKTVKNKMFKILTFVLLFINLSTSFAQLDLGADLVSRYVWRGTDFGQAPSIQPTINFVTGGFEVGFWGAYQLGRDASSLPADELDFYLGYTFEIGSSSLDFVATDYFFPNAGGRFGDFDGDGKGAHIVELGATFSLPESLPLYLSAYVNVYNDPDNSSYFELGYSTTITGVGFDVFLGASPGGDNMYYGNDKFAFVNVGITASKEIKITDDFSLPVFGSYIINPDQDKAQYVFGISL